MIVSTPQARIIKDQIKNEIHSRNMNDRISGIGVTWDNDGQAMVLIRVRKDCVQEIKDLVASLGINFPIQYDETDFIASAQSE